MKYGNQILLCVVFCLGRYVSACDDNFSSLGILLDEIGNRRPRQARTILTQKNLLLESNLPRQASVAIFNRKKWNTSLAIIVEEDQYDTVHSEAMLPL